MKDDARIRAEFEQYKAEKEKEVAALKGRILVLEADLKAKAGKKANIVGSEEGEPVIVAPEVPPLAEGIPSTESASTKGSRVAKPAR